MDRLPHVVHSHRDLQGLAYSDSVTLQYRVRPPAPGHSPDQPPRHTANEKNVCRHRAITLSAGMGIKVHPCPANQSDHHDRNRIFQSV